jgi:hypothetical protein
MLPRGSASTMAPLAPPPREVGSHAAICLRPMIAPLALPLRFPCYHVTQAVAAPLAHRLSLVLSRGSTPVVTSLIPHP